MELNELIPEKKLTEPKKDLQEEKVEKKYENTFHQLVGDEFYNGIKTYGGDSKDYMLAFEDYYKHLSEEDRKQFLAQTEEQKNPQERANKLLQVGKDYYNNSRYGLIQKAGGFEKYMDKCEQMLLEQKEEIEKLKKQQNETANKQEKVLEKKQTNNLPSNSSYSKRNPYQISEEEVDTYNSGFIAYVLHGKINF